LLLSSQCVEAFKAVAFLLSEKINEPGPGTPIEILDLCRRFSLDALGLSQLSYDFSAVKQKGEALTLTLLRECGEEWEKRRLSPWRRSLYWAFDAWTDGYKRLQVMHQFVGALTLEIKERGQAPAGDTSFWAQVTQRLKDPRTMSKATDDQIMAEVGGLLKDGLDPLSNALAWTLFLLATRPDLQVIITTAIRSSMHLISSCPYC
jgi:cytochrome P450